MAQNFPFEINADKYSRQLWSKQAYLYLAEFFRKAVFDTNVQVIEGGTIDDYRLSGPADDWRLPGRGSGDTEGDYAFKITATENMDGNGDPYDPPKFTVKVLGGTAQTLGGTPYVYDDEELSDVEEGWHIYVVYENLEPAPSFTEYGEWRPGIKASSAADMAVYTAPHDLVFEIGRISKEYIGNVRQDHKGNIVMPAISNVVDIQTQLP